MRLIGEIEHPKQAEAFAAWLITAGMPAKVDFSKQGKAEIWIHEEDHLSQAVKELAEFQSNPDDAKYYKAVPEAIRLARELEQKQKRIQKKIIIGHQKLAPKPQMTIAFMVLCVIASLFTNFCKDRNDLFKFLSFNGVAPPESYKFYSDAGSNVDNLSYRLASLSQGQVWRLVSPIFLHHSAMHLIFNMMWLFQLGRMIEFRYGKWRFLLLILISAAISNLIQCTVPSRFDGTYPGLLEDGTLVNGLGGFSGVVYGLFGFVWVQSIFEPRSRFFLTQSTITIMVAWLIFCMVPGPDGKKLTQTIFGFEAANWAHAIGLAVGIAAAFLPVWEKRNRVGGF